MSHKILQRVYLKRFLKTSNNVSLLSPSAACFGGSFLPCDSQRKFSTNTGTAKNAGGDELPEFEIWSESRSFWWHDQYVDIKKPGRFFRISRTPSDEGLCEYSYNDLKEKVNLRHRDFRVLSDYDSGHGSLATLIASRDDHTIISAMGIRALITKTDVLLYHPDVKEAFRQGVTDLIDGLSAYVKLRQNERFEIVALEGVMSYIVDCYRKRLFMYYPIVHHIISDLKKPCLLDFQQLLTITNSVTNLEKALGEFKSSIQDILSNQSDIDGLVLSSKADSDKAVEETLENFLFQVTKIERHAAFMKLLIESTQELIGLTLDSIRNHRLQMTLKINIFTACMTMVSTMGAVFGMNLLSGLEELPGYFWATCGGTSAVAAMVGVGIMQSMKSGGRALGDTSVEHEHLRELLSLMPDIQAVFMQQREAMTKHEFKTLLEHVSGRDVSDQAIDLTFSHYDAFKDGKINVNDYMTSISIAKNRLKQHHSKHVNDPVTHMEMPTE